MSGRHLSRFSSKQAHRDLKVFFGRLASASKEDWLIFDSSTEFHVTFKYVREEPPINHPIRTPSLCRLETQRNQHVGMKHIV